MSGSSSQQGKWREPTHQKRSLRLSSAEIQHPSPPSFFWRKCVSGILDSQQLKAFEKTAVQIHSSSLFQSDSNCQVEYLDHHDRKMCKKNKQAYLSFPFLRVGILHLHLAAGLAFPEKSTSAVVIVIRQTNSRRGQKHHQKCRPSSSAKSRRTRRRLISS